MTKRGSKRLTEAKKQRAIDALVALIECDDFPRDGTISVFDEACGYVRRLEVGA